MGVAEIECIFCKQGVFRSPVTGNHSGPREIDGTVCFAQWRCEAFDEDNLVDCPDCGGDELVVDEHGQEWTCLFCKGAGRVDGPRDQS